ncbi:MAG: RDD family protein [Gammaproteobacteria bacterium]
MTERGTEDLRGAGLPRRLAAILYDTLLVIAIVFLGTLPLVLLNDGEAIAEGSWWYRGYLLLLVGGYFVFFWMRGETLGMKSWRMRLVPMATDRITAGVAISRALASVLSWLPLGAGFLWCLVDREGLAWHDRLSRTRLVVREQRRLSGSGTARKP